MIRVERKGIGGIGKMTGEKKNQKIGEVVLRFDHYTGTDTYDDGQVEDYLLQAVRDNNESELEQVIASNPEWAVYYHLSPFRHNILNWYPFDKERTALEIGAGCGALTGLLSDACRQVTCVELSERRSMINAYRNSERSNIEIWISNFEDFATYEKQKYDYITLIGVLEYSELYIHAREPQTSFLEMIRAMLQPDGVVFIAIENKMGMKYWAGCKEDHFGKAYVGIEDYAGMTGIRTFSNVELDRLLRGAGFSDNVFYYPYPDYKFPTAIYSDAYLPRYGMLTDNLRNLDMERYRVFDEAKAFNNIIRDSMFPFFSNSYLVLAKA